jgi:hypothetical protein
MRVFDKQLKKNTKDSTALSFNSISELGGSILSAIDHQSPNNEVASSINRLEMFP